MSDRVVVMDAGRVQQIDTPDSAYYRPNSRFVAGFLGLANFLDGEIDASSGIRAIRLDSGETITVGQSGETRLTGRSAASSVRKTSSLSTVAASAWSGNSARGGVPRRDRALRGRLRQRPQIDGACHRFAAALSPKASGWSLFGIRRGYG